ncbi:MAG: hypothetical protein LIO62_03450 [Clostridiales bacterium]|nr:hypothetical protein [Clostridiales bacterium]
MWLSKQTVKGQENPTVQTGTSTLSTQNYIEASATGVSRDVRLYSPYGYSYSLPTGEKVLLAQTDGTQAGIGIAMAQQNLNEGEIKISSPFGGYIFFSNDGSVTINGLKINSNGEIV